MGFKKMYKGDALNQDCAAVKQLYMAQSQPNGKAPDIPLTVSPGREGVGYFSPSRALHILSPMPGPRTPNALSGDETKSEKFAVPRLTPPYLF
jgi:hypothetical protein